MNQITEPDHLQAAQAVRSLLATYEDNSELIQIGAYKRGTDHDIDKAIHSYPKIRQFLNQDILEYESIESSIKLLKSLLQRSEERRVGKESRSQLVRYTK